MPKFNKYRGSIINALCTILIRDLKSAAKTVEWVQEERAELEVTQKEIKSKLDNS